MSFRKAYGYSHSENGWRMCNRDECVVANPLPYTNTAPIRAGDAATILNAWIIWYHRNVEPLTSPVWGWSNENAVGNSNHLSGTAVDINAPKYPWGLRSMPAARIAKVREGLRLFEGSVFWGADWGRADEMHYQIGWREGDPRVAAFAAKLNAGHLGIYSPGPAAPAPAPAPTVSRPTISRGSTGDHVRYLQTLLNRAYPLYSRLVVDGDFGPATESVVREFQRRAGLAVDGVVGPATWRRLGVS
ncbi:peptidoglycan-binding protein [Rhodococcus sp. NPDC003382]